MARKDSKKKKKQKSKKGHKKDRRKKSDSFEDVSSESSSDLTTSSSSSSSSSDSSSESEGEENSALTKAKAMLKFRETFQKRLEQRERAAGKTKTNVKELFDASVPLDIEDLKAEFDNAPVPSLENDDILRGGQEKRKSNKVQDFSNVTVGKLPIKGPLPKSKPEKLVNHFFAKELVNPKPKASIKIGIISQKIQNAEPAPVSLAPGLEICPVSPPDGHSILKSSSERAETQETKPEGVETVKKSAPRIIHQISEPDPDPVVPATPEAMEHEIQQPVDESVVDDLEEQVGEDAGEGESMVQGEEEESYKGPGPAPLPPANYCSAPVKIDPVSAPEVKDPSDSQQDHSSYQSSDYPQDGVSPYQYPPDSSRSQQQFPPHAMQAPPADSSQSKIPQMGALAAQLMNDNSLRPPVPKLPDAMTARFVSPQGNIQRHMVPPSGFPIRMPPFSGMPPHHMPMPGPPQHPPMMMPSQEGQDQQMASDSHSSSETPSYDPNKHTKPDTDTKISIRSKKSFPPGFDPAQFPPGFDPSKMPPGFDPSKMPRFPMPPGMKPGVFPPGSRPPFDPTRFPFPFGMRPPFDGGMLRPGMPPPPLFGHLMPPPEREKRSRSREREHRHHEGRRSYSEHKRAGYERGDRHSRERSPLHNGADQWGKDSKSHDKPISPTTPEIDPRAVREALKFLQGTTDIDDDVVRKALMTIKSKQKSEKSHQKSYSAAPTAYSYSKPPEPDEPLSPEILPHEAERIVREVQEKERLAQQQQQEQQSETPVVASVEESGEIIEESAESAPGPEIPATGLPEPDYTPAADLDKSDWQMAPKKSVRGETLVPGYTFPPEDASQYEYSEYYMHYYQQALHMWNDDKEKPVEARFPVSQGYGHKRALEKGGAVKGSGRAILFNKEEIQGLVFKRRKIAQEMVKNPESSELMDKMEAVQHKLNECGVTDTEIAMMETSQMQSAWKKRRQEEIPAWTRPDLFYGLPMVRSAVGMAILKKQGWVVGQVLGRGCPYGSAFGAGSLHPLEFLIKTDQAGLLCAEERAAIKAKKFGDAMPSVITEPLPAPRATISGRHPVAALADYCHQQKWKQPQYTLLKEEGAAHKKLFVFQVTVKCGKFTTPNGATNKRQAKSDAAAACLERLGLMTSLPPGYS